MAKRRSTMTVSDVKDMLAAQGFQGRDQVESQRALENPSPRLKKGQEDQGFQDRKQDGAETDQGQPQEPDQGQPGEVSAQRVNWNSRQPQGGQPEEPKEEPKPSKPARGIGVDKKE